MCWRLERRSIWILLCACLWLWGCPTVEPSERVGETSAIDGSSGPERDGLGQGKQELSLRLMSYNIPFFPLGIKMGRHEERTKALVDIINQMKDEERPHVIGLQEVWHNPIKDKIAEALKERYPHVYLDKANDSLVNSGLMILSQYPIEKREIKHYSDSFGNESFAMKGVMGVRFALPGGRKLSLLMTHLQSSSKKEANETKLKQLREAHAFFQNFTKDDNGPVVFMGDFNLSVEKNPEYLAKAKAIFPYLRDLYAPPAGKEQKASTWAGIKGTGFTQRIDHMWVLRENDEKLSGYAYLLTIFDDTVSGHLALWGTIKLP